MNFNSYVCQSMLYSWVFRAISTKCNTCKHIHHTLVINKKMMEQDMQDS